ncbi:S41 family peptidase [bacterium]|nr:MAG: S41 family peptidase [bacterium]
MDYQQTYNTNLLSNNDASKSQTGEKKWLFWIINPMLFLIIGSISFLAGFFINKSQFLGTMNLGDVLLTKQDEVVCTFNRNNQAPAQPTNNNSNSTFVSTKFQNIFSILNTKYVDKSIDQNKLDEGAIKGMVDALNDPATMYLTKDETSDYNQSLGGGFEGVGMELGYSDGWIIVKKPIPDSPAEKSGILAGDYIAKVDDYIVKKNDNITDVVYKIRGPKGTTVKITVVKDTTGTSENVISIVRAPIETKSMEIVDEGNDIYRLIISRFTDNTYEEFISNWKSIATELKSKNPKGIILDLRGNPGGFLDAAHYIAEEFLPLNTVTLHEAGRDGISKTYKVTRKGEFLDTPMVTLVNSTSASASEILAGALQQNSRSQLIGENTFGKGTAQQILDLPDGSSLHLTVKKWLLPDKKNINHETPIVPDLKVDITVDDIRLGLDKVLEKSKQELLNPSL